MRKYMALKRVPRVMSDKYNVKATIINPPDLAALRRPIRRPAAKNVAALVPSRGGDGGTEMTRLGTTRSGGTVGDNGRQGDIRGEVLKSDVEV